MKHKGVGIINRIFNKIIARIYEKWYVVMCYYQFYVPRWMRDFNKVPGFNLLRKFLARRILKAILMNLSCDIHDGGLPCHTCLSEAGKDIEDLYYYI